jgi:hypothetical protein
MLKEVTAWNMSGGSCNHLYLFEEKPKGRTAKALGYIRSGTDEVVKFKNGLVIEMKNRNFIEVKKVKI